MLVELNSRSLPLKKIQTVDREIESSLVDMLMFNRKIKVQLLLFI